MTPDKTSDVGVARVTWPSLNANSSKTAKGTNFKFDRHVPGIVATWPLTKVSETLAWPGSHDHDNSTVQTAAMGQILRCYYLFKLKCLLTLFWCMYACSRIERTTSKIRKAMHWSGANRLKQYSSIITATMWRKLRGQPASHDCRLSHRMTALCTVSHYECHDW